MQCPQCGERRPRGGACPTCDAPAPRIPRSGILAADPRIRRSSQSLHQAYDELMRAYPGETDHNRQAFFDHLCALDFV